MKYLFLFFAPFVISYHEYHNKNDLILFAKIASNSYNHVGSNSWLDVSDSWTLIDSIGWGNETTSDGDGIRAYIFKSTNTSINELIVSFKGTSASFFGIDTGPTSHRDKINDNLMFGCCPIDECITQHYTCDRNCIKDDLDRDPDYYFSLLKASFEKVALGKDVVFIGHSLGGSLAALASLEFPNSLAITFESPGTLFFANKIQKNRGGVVKDNIFNYGSKYDPIFMGECHGFSSSCFYAGYTMNTVCHIGEKCVFKEETKSRFVVESSESVEETFLKVENILQHRMHYILYILENTELPYCRKQEECKDCIDWDYNDF
jgi:putative lipase involved disintegration of autophagic bodies